MFALAFVYFSLASSIVYLLSSGRLVRLALDTTRRLDILPVPLPQAEVISRPLIHDTKPDLLLWSRGLHDRTTSRPPLPLSARFNAGQSSPHDILKETPPFAIPHDSHQPALLYLLPPPHITPRIRITARHTSSCTNSSSFHAPSSPFHLFAFFIPVSLVSILSSKSPWVLLGLPREYVVPPSMHHVHVRAIRACQRAKRDRNCSQSRCIWYSTQD